MRAILRFLLVSQILFSCACLAQGVCPPRPGAGSVVTDPLVLRSQGGVLTVDLTMINNVDQDNIEHYCYVYADGSEAPTLFANPGDRIVFNLTNHLTPTPGTMSHLEKDPTPAGDCSGGMMSSATTNVHFHGLNIPPKCHQDETIKTMIQPNDPPFQYSFVIPKNDPPGLYWYHPHPHGITVTQVLGGATGAIIIGGMEQVRPEVAGLAERTLIMRQFSVLPPPPGKKHSPDPDDSDDNAPISVNFVPAFAKVVPPTILMKPSERQLWRVVNSTSIYFLTLQMQYSGQAQKMELVAVDGIPLDKTSHTDTIVVPPAGRAEFIVQGPPLDVPAQFMSAGFDTGPAGDFNPPWRLANVVATADAPEPPNRMPAFVKKAEVTRFTGLAAQKATKKRKLYFSEVNNTANTTTQFFITVDGQTPKLYDPDEAPAIVTQEGAIEDWVIENRSGEVHAFHIHQLHFIVLERNGKPVNDPTVRDTVVVPYWDGVSKHYPSVKLRMDFRDPELVGTFLYHCHILDHEDGGMMAKIKVKPKK